MTSTEIVYSAVIVHRSASVAHTTGTLVCDGPVIEDEIKEYVLGHVLERDIPEQLGLMWHPGDCQITKFFWSDVSPTENEE